MAASMIEKYADVLVMHSQGTVNFREAWENGQKRMLLIYDLPADELAMLVAERVYSMGGDVFLRPVPSWSEYANLTKASDDVLGGAPNADLDQHKYVASRLVIRGSENTRSLASVDPQRRTKASLAKHPYTKETMKTDDRGEFIIPWTVTQFPTPAYAQDADMSFADYQQWAYEAMHLDSVNPVDTWGKISHKQQRLIDESFGKAETVRILHSEYGTDLKMSIKGHRWINAHGKRNFPDGEIFTAPHKGSVNGYLKIPPTFPQYHKGGPEVSGISLIFKDGEAIKWQADVGNDYLTAFLKSNPGANRLGELGIGMNSRIQRPTKQILYDEKIGGTIHVAFGLAYQTHVLGDGDRSGLNVSPEHWDLIMDMRQRGAWIELSGPDMEKRRMVWDSEAGLWLEI